MLVIRKDGLGEHYPDDIDIDKFFETNINTHIAIKKDGKFYTKVDVKEIFTKKLNNCMVLPYVDENAKLLTDNDKIDEYPFFLKGYFGIRKDSLPITGIVTNEVLTLSGNRFKLYGTSEMAKLLLIDSHESVKLMTIKFEAKIIGNALNGIGLTVGLILSPESIGTLV